MLVRSSGILTLIFSVTLYEWSLPTFALKSYPVTSKAVLCSTLAPGNVCNPSCFASAGVSAAACVYVTAQTAVSAARIAIMIAFDTGLSLR